TAALRTGWLQIFSLVTGILVATFGFVVFLSFLFKVPTFNTVKTNSALAFLFAGLCLVLMVKDRKKSRLALVLSSLVTVIGLFAILEFWLNTDLYIDEFFGRVSTPGNSDAHPGRISPAAAVAITLIGISLLGHVLHKTIAFAQSLAITVLLFGFVPLVGYAYDVPALYS